MKFMQPIVLILIFCIGVTLNATAVERSVKVTYAKTLTPSICKSLGVNLNNFSISYNTTWLIKPDLGEPSIINTSGFSIIGKPTFQYEGLSDKCNAYANDIKISINGKPFSVEWLGFETDFRSRTSCDGFATIMRIVVPNQTKPCILLLTAPY